MSAHDHNVAAERAEGFRKVKVVPREPRDEVRTFRAVFERRHEIEGEALPVCSGDACERNDFACGARWRPSASCARRTDGGLAASSQPTGFHMQHFDSDNLEQIRDAEPESWATVHSSDVATFSELVRRGFHLIDMSGDVWVVRRAGDRDGRPD